MIEKLVRKNILNLKPYTSARDSFLDGILLDANENSLGSTITDAQNLKLNRYPDPAQNQVREKLAKYLNIDKEKLFLGVGSDEIIDLLIRIFCNPGEDSVLITEPTYGMYRVACNINDVKVLSVPLNRNFQINVKNTLKKVQKNTKIIFLCSPNNPTGNLLNKKNVLKIVRNFNGIVVIDEAYIDFCEDHSYINSVKKYKNLVIMRTFSKAWGLAGIRAGYSIADKFITDLLFKIKAPYNLNKLTANAILEALSKVKQKNNFVRKLNLEKDKLIKQLKEIKHVKKVFPSDANFILFKVKKAKDVYVKLASEGIIIRDRSDQPGLEDCLRVSISTEKENNNFIKKLKKVI
ncbi:histidinol-phosphate aminotransferase [bacterium BMS3Abin04]|nr:histidinol-phosphate aminotransferase [bacterium BMS3Abin04]